MSSIGDGLAIIGISVSGALVVWAYAAVRIAEIMYLNADDDDDEPPAEPQK